MKKFARTLLLFVLFFMIFYPVMLFIWGYNMPSIFMPNLNYRRGSYGHLYSRLKNVKSIKNVDVLILGSSHAYRGFDTRIFNANGISSFNLGSSAQTPTQTKVLLKRYLSYVNPKLIIYEVYPETFSNDGVESSLDIIANDKNDLYSIDMAFKLNHIKCYNTLIYGITMDVLNLNSSYVEPIYRNKDKYIPGGFVERDISFYKHIKYQPQKWKFNEAQYGIFSDIVSTIKKTKIPLILVYAPISPSLYHSYTNNNVFDSIMNTYSDYYNFNDSIILNDSTDFYDSNHLNQIGVKLFNDKLIEVLKKSNVLTNNRTGCLNIN
jgi:hypothetical protein